jgi:hypothetical protein
MNFDPYTGKPIKSSEVAWWKRNLWAIIACAALFFVGIAIGATGEGATRTADTVTSTVTSPPQTVTETSPPETVIETKTPQSCLDALEDMRIASTQMGKALQAATNLDYATESAAIKKANGAVSRATPLYYQCALGN